VVASFKGNQNENHGKEKERYARVRAWERYGEIKTNIITTTRTSAEQHLDIMGVQP